MTSEWIIWDLMRKNYPFHGFCYFNFNLETLEKYTKVDKPTKLKSLSNRSFIKDCDKFLPLKHGNILHGSSFGIFKALKDDAESAYPLVFESFYGLLCDFLDHKTQFGTHQEKAIYNGMNACDLVHRLLTKRCVSYYGRNENYLLQSGHKSQGDFATIGTDRETDPLLMSNCLTRDEIKLAAFLVISSKVTKTIRDKTYRVVMIGIPFPILNREGLFDWEDVMVTRKQNTIENGYGTVDPGVAKDSELFRINDYRSIWNRFYNHKIATVYSTMDKKYGIRINNETIRRFWKTATHTYIDLYKLAHRFFIINCAILQEGNERAKVDKKMAYLIIDKNKIGLRDYPSIFEEIFLRNLSYSIFRSYKSLNNTKLVHLVDFAEIDTLKNGWSMTAPDGVYGNEHPLKGVEIKFSTKLELNVEMPEILSDDRHLVVETYRLDGNALPGNQIWQGKVSKDYWEPSFDVRHTAIPFIHNPFINKTRLCGGNLRIYSDRSVFDWDKMSLWYNRG